MVQFRKNKRFMGIHKVILSMIVAALMIEQLAAGTIVDLDVRRLSTNEPRKSSLPNQGDSKRSGAGPAVVDDNKGVTPKNLILN
ncbi:hypothetical protein BDA96_10G189100 [Sorghum bicolor]|uniref:Uncharacterized protein n=1 Tax=Sorghum bicolor TaxID=4558 RepID=A0A921Q3W6_SORBI|nr:hypothetical protein BDA96_10G189100 [Sorghum bicolor]